jgi:hypothetical protein
MPADSLTLSAAEAAQAIALQMLAERGRGAVLVGAARVDAVLERLIKAVLAPVSPKDDELFKPERPLGSFGAKIALAARLGLIDTAVEKALHTLRRVRNAFAHSSGDVGLTDLAHKSRLADAYTEARSNPLWRPLEQLLVDKGSVDSELRDYILLITILVAFLEATAQQLNPLKPPVLMSFGGIVKN